MDIFSHTLKKGNQVTNEKHIHGNKRLGTSVGFFLLEYWIKVVYETFNKPFGP